MGGFIWNRCPTAASNPSSRYWMPNWPRTPKKLSPTAIPLTRALFPERNTREEITARNFEISLERKSRQGTSRARLDNDADGGERVFAFQAGHRRQLSQAQSLALGPL